MLFGISNKLTDAFLYKQAPRVDQTLIVLAKYGSFGYRGKPERALSEQSSGENQEIEPGYMAPNLEPKNTYIVNRKKNTLSS